MTTSLGGRFPEAETPIHGYLYSMIELGVLRFCFEYGIFKAIPPDPSSTTTISQLAGETGVNPNLLSRQVSFLVAAGVLNSPSPGHVEHTPLSRTFQEPLATLFYPYLFDFFMGTAVKWPEYFRTNGAEEPQKSDAAPFGFAMGHPDKSFYEVLELMPDRAKSFNDAMALPLDDMPITGIYDFGRVVSDDALARAANAPGTTPCIVDVGGGMGQALKAILEMYPSIPASSCVVEDRAEVIQQASEQANGVMLPVRKIAHSFFDEQPVQGALIYYIRRVLNDWPDEECVQILSRIRRACAAHSRVVIAENLLPDKPSLGFAGINLWMMNFGGKRRNEEMFKELASKAGFRLSAVSKDETTNMGVVEMLPI